MKLEFKRLGEVAPSEYVALNTHPLVMRQMPLSDDSFNEEVCREWIKGKEKMWEEHGYGPWAFIVDDKFAGWGGLQPEQGDADLGLVFAFVCAFAAVGFFAIIGANAALHYAA